MGTKITVVTQDPQSHTACSPKRLCPSGNMVSKAKDAPQLLWKPWLQAMKTAAGKWPTCQRMYLERFVQQEDSSRLQMPFLFVCFVFWFVLFLLSPHFWPFHLDIQVHRKCEESGRWELRHPDLYSPSKYFSYHQRYALNHNCM